MRKKINMIFMSLLSLLLLTACSGDEKVAMLFEKLPADADMVAVVNLTKVVGASGGSIENGQVKLPKLLLDSLSENGKKDVEYYSNLISSGYVEPGSFAVMKSYADSDRPILVMTLSDPDMFVKVIHSDGFLKFSNDKSITYYTATRWDADGKESYPCYAITTSHVYYLSDVAPGSSSTPADVLASLLSRIQQKPFSRTPAGEYLADCEGVSIAYKASAKVKELMKKSDVQKLQEGTLCLKGAFEGDALKLTGKVIGADGSDADCTPLKDLFDASGKINGKALLGDVLNTDSVLQKNINTAKGLTVTGSADAESVSLNIAGGKAKGIVEKLIAIFDGYAYPAPPAAPAEGEE